MEESSLVLDVTDYFREKVVHALKECSVESHPIILNYLVDLLKFYMSADNLYESSDKNGKKAEKMLAQRLLEASSADPLARAELLKQLADSSLYVSGFFGDSLKSKIVDIDYYAEIGGIAYANLAAHSHKKTFIEVYNEFSQHFLKYVDVLTFISQKVFIQSQEDVLRLYDRYIATGSDLAKKQLIEMDVLSLPKTADDGLN